MKKKVIIISGSPKRDGNTGLLINWFLEGLSVKECEFEVIAAGSLSLKSFGCCACRICQEREAYGCVLDDDASLVLKRMIDSDLIVMATPLYFFSASAQIKAVFDRMFSLYKWDNRNNTFITPLSGKTFVLIASAYEDVGLGVLESPFKLTAEYSNMSYRSFLVPDAGVSGQIKNIPGIKEKTISFAKSLF
ncbi:MAG: flavodoxin family protein [Candidatus Omnitrophica bacterium]|nr:flavodoxin family protein [Candidatus Omnitrophota bacterium]